MRIIRDIISGERCAACVDICPVKAVRLENDTCMVDTDWCIGCGACLYPALPDRRSQARPKVRCCPAKGLQKIARDDMRERTG